MRATGAFGLLSLCGAVSWAFVASRDPSLVRPASIDPTRASVAARVAHDDAPAAAARAAWESLKAFSAGSPWANPNLNPTPSPSKRELWLAANSEFVRAFRSAGAGAFDPVRDLDLLKHGLWMLFCEARTAGDGPEAVRLCELYIATTPTMKSLAEVSELAPTCLLAGEVSRAEKIWSGAMASDNAIVLCYSRSGLAHIRSARGDFDGARELWETIVDEPKLDRYFKQGARQNLALVGQTPPDLPAADWVGGDAPSLAALRGRVVLISFFDASMPWTNKVLTDLTALQNKYNDRGLAVLGMAWFGTRRPPLPRETGDVEPDGHADVVSGVTAETLPAHLAELRVRLSLDYPLAVLAEDGQSWGAYSQYAMTVLVDVEGRVAYVTGGGGGTDRDPLLKLAIDRLLSAKSGAAHPDRR